MNKKIMTAQEPKRRIIMEFRELIDGNFMMILNGDKLKEKVDSGSFSIDLNSPIAKGKHSPVSVLLSHKIKNFLRGELPKVIKKEIFDLNNDSKRINAFAKKYGFDAIEVPAVRNYFKELLSKARNKGFEENDGCKKQLKQLIVAMSHTDRKVRIIADFSIPNMVRHLERIEEEANSFYPSVVKYCRNCLGKKSSYSQCNERIECQHVIDHIKERFPDCKQKQITNILTFNTKSEYIAENFRKKLGVDRTRGEELLKYAKAMKKLS